MKTRIIQTRFWDDEFVTETSMHSQHLYIYLLTNQYINISGVFQLGERKIIFETKLSEDEFKEAKNDLETAKKAYFYNGWVYVTNALKNNNYTNSPKNQKALEKEIERIPKEVKKHFNLDTTMDTTIDTSIDSTIKKGGSSLKNDTSMHTTMHSSHKSKTINHKSKTINQKTKKEKNKSLPWHIIDALEKGGVE